MPKFAEIFHLSGSKKTDNSSGIFEAGNKDYSENEDRIDAQIPQGEELTRGVEAFVKEAEARPISNKSPDVHSRRILPSDKPTIHFDARHPLPAREVMVHKDHLEAYKQAAFEKHELNLRTVREKISASNEAAAPEKINMAKEEVAGALPQEAGIKSGQDAGNNSAEQAEKIKRDKMAKIDREMADLERKMAAEDAGVTNEELARRTGADSDRVQFGRRLEKSQKPIRDPWREDKELYDRIVMPSGAKKDRREYDSEIGSILNDLDRLTDSENILDHYAAAELIKSLTLEQKQKVQEKSSPELMRKLDSIEEPEFGRREVKIEKSYAPKNEFVAVENAYRKIVGDSKMKKTRRDYQPEAVVTPPVKKKAIEYVYDKDFIKKKARAAEEAAQKKQSSQALDKKADTQNNQLPKSEKTVSGPVENFLTPEQGREIDALANALKEKKLAEIVSEPEAAPVKKAEEGEERKKKNESFWKKAGRFLKEHELATQLIKTGISIPASILGYKSFYDVPAYLTQRYAVRGNIMGIGQGKGLGGSVEELLNINNQSRNGRKNEDYKEGSNPKSLEDSAVMKAIKDLDKRLAKTKEGSEKKSEQRNKIAKLLWENRHQEKQTKEARQKELENILDNYTTTKVTGIQAAREALNTACVATGAFALRGVAYGGLAFFEQQEKMRREGKIKALEKGPEAKAEELNAAKVLVQSVRETFDGLRGRTGKNKLQKGVAAIKSFGSIARLVGIAIGVGSGGHAYGASLDKVIDILESKDKLAAIGHNFVSNAERYEHLLPTIGKTLGNIFNHEGVALADSLSNLDSHDYGASASIPQNEVINSSAKFDFNQESAQIKSMTGEEIPEASFQGGKSVWQEGGKQLLARFGDKFSHLDKAAQEANIARLQKAIIADPEEFGLPKNIDFNRMSTADLKNMNWDEAVNIVFGNREGLTDVVHNLDKTLANPDENLVRFGGSIEPVAPDLGDGQDVNAINYFSGEKIQANLEELSDKARKFYDPSTSQIDKRRIFAELQEARENIGRATGGTVVFSENGDINVTLANGEVINAFGKYNLPEAGITNAEAPVKPIAAVPHRPSLGYNSLDPHHEGISSSQPNSENGQNVLAAVEINNPDSDYEAPPAEPASIHETPGHSEVKTEVLPHVGDPRDIREPITKANVAKALLRNAEHPRNINVHRHGEISLDLRHVKEISPEALKVWQNKPGTYNFYGLQKIDEETYQTLTRYKGKFILNDQAFKQFEDFDKKNAENADWFKKEDLGHFAKPDEDLAELNNRN